MKKLIILAVTMLSMAIGVAVAAAPASAATYPYDYTNPASTGCSNSGGPANGAASTVPIYDPEISGDVLGYVELRWSTGCTTNWSRVSIRSGAAYGVPAAGIRTWAHRQADGADTQGHDGDPGPYYAASAYSDQLYGNGLRVCAWGQLAYQSINGPIGWATNFYCF